MKNNQNMKRVIVDFSKLNNNILNLLVTKYPDGYDDASTISFKNQHNEIIECVEVKTIDTIYLVKVSKKLVTAMEDFEIVDHENLDLDIEALDN
jgi:DNA-directed RNA polymerase subunit delta